MLLPTPPPPQSKYQSNNLVQIAGYFMKTGTGGCLILKIFQKRSSFDFQNFAKKKLEPEVLGFPHFCKKLELDALQFPKF